MTAAVRSGPAGIAASAVATAAIPAWPLPRVLLLDEGGVLSLSEDNTQAPGAAAARITELLRRAGIRGLGTDLIAADIRSAKVACAEFKRAHQRDAHPLEVEHRRFWRDLVAARWPTPARTLVELDCRELSGVLSAGNVRRCAPGAVEMLAWATGRSLRVGLVANTFAAETTRGRLAGWGLDRFFSVQVHSDEMGYRKPDPRLLETAMTALRAAPPDCWYVGDSRAKDIECARRADVAVAVLVSKDGDPGDAGPEPDLRVGGCAELLDVLRRCADRPDAGEEGACP